MRGKQRLKPGPLPGNRAQVSLELSISLIAACILLVASVKLFVWLNNRFILRQQDYEAGRVGNTGQLVDDSNVERYKRLEIFPLLNDSSGGQSD